MNETYTRIPDSLFEAARRGELTPCEFITMVWLHKKADRTTGVVSAEAMKEIKGIIMGFPREASHD